MSSLSVCELQLKPGLQIEACLRLLRSVGAWIALLAFLFTCASVWFRVFKTRGNHVNNSAADRPISICSVTSCICNAEARGDVIEEWFANGVRVSLRLRKGAPRGTRIFKCLLNETLSQKCTPLIIALMITVKGYFINKVLCYPRGT